MMDTVGKHFKRRLQVPFAMIVAAILVVLPAGAQTTCVTCDGPSGVYSCSLAPGAGSGQSRAARRIQLACIQDIARRYGHASCGVKNNQVGSCNGQVHMISTVARPAAVETSRDAVSEAKPDVSKKQVSGEPRTVIDLAERTASDAEKQIKRSAKTVTKAARSTWQCVASLFSDC